jgi:hypothetical protein
MISHKKAQALCSHKKAHKEQNNLIIETLMGFSTQLLLCLFVAT